MQNAKKNQNNNEEENSQEQLCEKCGSKLVTEEGSTFCPNCQGQIDFFGEDDED
jgi:uncharacterized Zn finger protein (UPF0148 family)